MMYDDQGKALEGIIHLVRALQPRLLYIQTSGAGPGVPDLSGQVTRILAAAGPCPVQFATSFTLYQRAGIEGRMATTLAVLAKAMAPRPLEVHLTTDPGNRAATMAAFQGASRIAGFTSLSIGAAGAICVRGNEMLAARMSATVAAGRAAQFTNLDPERQPANPDFGCEWLARNRIAMQVLTDGEAYVCCSPRAYRNPTHIVNVFQDDPVEFFQRYASLRRRLIDVICGRDGEPSVTGRCARCNLVDHRTLALRCE